MKSELLLRLLIADLVGEAVTLESISPLRDEIDDLGARLDEAEESAHSLPHREKYLLLTIAYLTRRLALDAGFIDDVRRELDGSAGADAAEQAVTAKP